MEPYNGPERSPYDDTPVVVTAEEALKHSQASSQQYFNSNQQHHGYQGQQHPYQTPIQQQQQPSYPYANPQEMPIAVSSEKRRVCGMTRKMLLIVALAAVLLAGCIGAAAAAGVLASQKNEAERKLGSVSPGQAASGDGNSSGDGESAGVNATTPIDGALASFAVQDDWGGATPSCPGSAGETYTVPGTTLTFKRECNTNYPGADLMRVPMSNMEDCMRMCAMMYKFPQSANGRCLMANWIYSDLQGQDDKDSWCWLKYGKGGGVSKADTETAYLVDDEGKYIGNDAKFSSPIDE